MEKLLTYQKIARDVVKAKVDFDKSGTPPYNSRFVADTENDIYMYLSYEWVEHKYHYGVYIHLDIIDGKVWIQWNYTEYDLAEELMERGVPPEDIVLGNVAPYMRVATPFSNG